ncbi:Peptidoglycan-binding domain 1 protein [Acidovorax delafieldii 2AN]|uniref:Peptidoglycan-binding domain 1 protein n=1 Tax=Acidovorax delafieldii 2AN TaxID=573060 RepID=C5T4M0_ACIDE|nr:DUF4384 domain-containing protein [Acidovorax delafieldii]EER60592.1 Peptidoglycan-binding domain 1 protein [Acidovorax delafieldii 2AN]
MKTALPMFRALQRQRLACTAAALAGVLLVQGCTMPVDARKDAAFQSYASQSDRPVVRPTRSISSFSDSLMCMDHLLREAQLPPTLITSKQIPDYSSRVPVASKDMIITALSQMSRLSNAFRFVDYEVDIARQDTVQNLTTILLNNNQMQLQRPALYLSGAVAYVDQNVISNRFDVGTSASRLDTGYSASRNATIIALEMHLGDFRTRTLIPGLDSANEVIIGGAGQGLDLAGRIGSYGVKFNVGRDYAQGAGSAMRTLIDLGTIELVGKWARVPYWQCLTLDQTHPNFQRQMRDWFDESGPQAQSSLVQSSLISRGYLPLGTEPLPSNSPQLRTALARFQADSGLVASGVVDFPTYERALRNYVTLAPDGTLARVGWTSTGAVATPATGASAGAAAVPEATIATAPEATRVELQIENPLPAGERAAFEEGEQVFLSATVSRTSHLYCYFADARGGVMRLLPNAIHPHSLVSAQLSTRIPDWMTPNPAFIMDAGKPGTEKVGCFASDTDPLPALPAPLQGPALKAVPGFRTIDDVSDAFAKSLGSNGFTRGEIQWQVTTKRSSPAQGAPAAKPAAR